LTLATGGPVDLSPVTLTGIDNLNTPTPTQRHLTEFQINQILFNITAVRGLATQLLC